MTRLLRRILAFAALPIASAFAPLVVLPLISRIGGPESWAAVGIGTAVGSLVSSFSFVGYSISGTAAVAVAPANRARGVRLYAEGFYTRLAVLCVSAPIGVLVTLLISPPQALVIGALFALAFSVNALSMSWFATGMGSPSHIFVFETGPRVLISLISALLILLTGNIALYPVLLAIGTVAGVLAYNMKICGRILPRGAGARSVRSRLLHFSSAWGVEVVGSSYSSIPVPLSGGILGATQTAPYVSADRVYRYGLFVVHALANALQSWVLEREDRRRQVAAIVLHSLLGISGAVFLMVFGRSLSRALFGESVTPDESIFIPLAIAFFSTSCSTPLMRNMLIPRGKQKELLRMVLISGACGVLVMIAGGFTFRTIHGIVYGLALSETIMLVGAAVLCRGTRPRYSQVDKQLD